MDYTTNNPVKQPLTLEDVAKMSCVMLSPEQASDLLGCDRTNIQVMARTEEGRQALGFPVIRIGSYTKIPRIPFLRKLGWEGRINGATEVIA